MSRIGNHVVEMQEKSSYQLGWESAERGDSRPSWDDHGSAILFDEKRIQQRGWDDYHAQEQS